nr:ribonuclease E inhibitor RraB [Pontibacter silvestris]
MYPDEESLQKIYNNRILKNLEEQGDQPFIPRTITHWIYFSTKEDREAFSAIAKGEGYSVRLEEEIEDQPGKPYKFVLHKEDKADEVTINEITLKLKEMAEQYNGEYDGWETEAITEYS